MSTFDSGSGGNGHSNGNGSGGGARQTTLREFSAILFRRKWIVLGLFAVTTLTVLLISLATPTAYVSSGSVYVKRGERESILQPGRRVLDDWEQALGTEMEIVKSEPVIRRAREILAAEAVGDTLALDPKSIDAEVKGKSNVMAIGYVDADPDVAYRVCDAVLRAYVEFRERDFAPSYPRQFFESEMRQVDADIKHWTELRRAFSNREGVIDAGEQNRQLIGQLSGLEQRRNEAEANLAEADARRAQVLALDADPDVDLATYSAMFSNDMSLVDLKRRILDQEARLAALRERLREEATDVVNNLKTLETLNSLLARELDGQKRIAATRSAQLRARLEVIDRDIAVIESDLRSMPDKETRLATMDREIEILERRQQELTEKSDQAKVTENTSSSINVMLLESAGWPRAVNARDYVRLALAPVFSIVVGIGLAFFVDGLDLTVRTARHAEEVVELPVLATLTDRRRRAR
jgi:uncharacterized protein involved in exopolysaccharide biosynthesis